MSTDPWHVYHDAPWLGAVHLKPVLVGVANRAPSSLLKPRPPVTRGMILILAAKLDLSDPFDCCCTAAPSAAFWGQLRLGEVLSPWELSFPTSLSCLAPTCHLPSLKIGPTNCSYLTQRSNEAEEKRLFSVGSKTPQT